MLIILTLALLPLGVIASLASFETARTNHANRALAAHLLAGDSADRMTLFLDRAAATLRAAARQGPPGCRRAAEELSGGTEAGRVALFNDAGKLVCASRPFAVTLPLVAASAPIVTLDTDDAAVRLMVSTGSGWALAEIPATMIAQASHPNAVDGSYDLRLADANGQTLPIATMRTVTIGRDIVTELPVSGGQLHLAMTVEASPLSANELLLMCLPILMWLAAAAIGWLVVDRLVLRPLAEMQRAIEASRTRGGPLVLPTITTPAQEIRDLGFALSGASATIVRHEAELEDGLARQTKLTREVHHRVKNNLQVVASLLNIHSRGAHTPEAVAAYGAIQRRVEALALVHRSHYAELEVNRGLALRPLIGELAANLRASSPPGLANPRVTLDLRLYSATQDVAVPVAFLITELVELAMFRVPGTPIAIALTDEASEPGRARLSLRSPALAKDAAPEDEALVRGLRVVTGLARQLRSTLAADEETGTYSVDILVLGETDQTLEPDAADQVSAQRGGALVPRHIAG